MNERIKELIRQSAVPADQAEDYALAKGLIEPAEKLDVAKFAELIVRECASICELNGQSYTHSFTPAKARLAESTSNHCGLMIKKHFGVEE